MLVVPLAVIAVAWSYWTSLQGKVSTDNAYVKQDMVAIGAEVGGRIIDVRVREDDVVKPGDLLFRIDPEPFQLQIAEATAAIATAQAGLTAMENNADLTGVDIAAARAMTTGPLGVNLLVPQPSVADWVALDYYAEELENIAEHYQCEVGRPEFGDDAPVHADAPLGDELLGGAA